MHLMHMQMSGIPENEYFLEIVGLLAMSSLVKTDSNY